MCCIEDMVKASWKKWQAYVQNFDQNGNLDRGCGRALQIESDLVVTRA